MYKICICCLLKARLGVFKMSLCISRICFFGAIWGFLKVDPALFAYDYLATLHITPFDTAF